MVATCHARDDEDCVRSSCNDCPWMWDDEDFTERDERFPVGFATIDYDSFDNAEAIDGARFDDRLFQHYYER